MQWNPYDAIGALAITERFCYAVFVSEHQEWDEHREGQCHGQHLRRMHMMPRKQIRRNRWLCYIPNVVPMIQMKIYGYPGNISANLVPVAKFVSQEAEDVVVRIIECGIMKQDEGIRTPPVNGTHNQSIDIWYWKRKINIGRRPSGQWI